MATHTKYSVVTAPDIIALEAEINKLSKNGWALVSTDLSARQRGDVPFYAAVMSKETA